jgi:hypothetical protein
MMEKEGRKQNAIGAHNALAALLSFAKSATRDKNECTILNQ